MEKHPFDSSAPFGASAGATSVHGKQRTLYELLNVSPTSTRTEVRESYIRMKNMFSSQNPALYSLMGDDEAQRMLHAVEDAFRVLNDDVKRRQYDIQLGIVDVEEAPNRSTHAVDSRSAMGEAPVTHQPAAPAQRSGGFTRAMVTPLRAADPAMQARLEEIMQAATDKGDGALFRKLREAAALSEEELHARTKISREYIRAIEDNAFDRLPQIVFVRGFLRSYLNALSVSQVEAMVAAFATRHSEWLISKNK